MSTTRLALPFTFNDGGRADAGYRGTTGDCGCRALAIVTGRPYQECYDLLIELARRERRAKPSHPRTGVHTPTFHRAAERLGLRWVPTKRVGDPTTVHLAVGELPQGRLICRVSKHYTAVINGVIHDNHDPSRDGTRMVYGYWAA